MQQTLSRILLLFLFVLGFGQIAKACHGLPLVNYSAVVGPTGVTINGSSDPATCGCGPYFLEVEVRCLSIANFTGNPPLWNAVGWNAFPWYHSLLNIPNQTAAAGWPDNCVLEPYSPVFVPFTDLCPGTVYFLRSRERVCGPGGTAGPWSATTTFTTPGSAPTFALSSTANNTTVCPGQPVTLSANLTPANACGGAGNATYTWTTVPLQPGTPIVGQTVTINPTSSCVVTLTATGGPLLCYTAPPSTVNITVNPPSTVGTVTVAPTTVCQGGCVTLSLSSFTNGTLQWQSSPNGITWSNIAGATTNNYLFCPVNAIMYFRAQIIGLCGNVFSNIVTVGIIPTANVNITASSTSICLGQSVTLTATGATSYQWNGGTLVNAPGASQTVTPSVTTTYVVSGNPSSACPGTRTVTIVVNQPPQLQFSPPSATICAGNAVTLVCGPDTNTYSWTGIGITSLSAPSNDSVSASPQSTTTYNVVATSPAGCQSNGSITVTVAPTPALVPTSDTLIICPNSPDTLTMIGAQTYVWSPLIGATMLNSNASVVVFSPAASQNYWVTGTSALGCVDSIPIYVDVQNNIVVTAGLDDSICPGTPTQLQATGGNSYSWTASSAGPIVAGQTATPTVAPTVNTTYIVNVTNSNGCFGSDTVSLFMYSLPNVQAGADTMLCANSSIILNPATGANSYVWTGTGITSGANTPSPTIGPSSSTTYIVYGTDGNQCQNSDTIQVTVNALPIANAGADVSICDSCYQISASGGAQYAWFPTVNLSNAQIGNPMACVSTTTSYTVTVTDANGCVNTDDITITVYPPLAVTASANTSICVGAQTGLSATASGGDGGPYGYTWTPLTGIVGSNTTQNINVSPTTTTTYTVTVTDLCGSTVAIDVVTVTVNALPVVNVTPDITSGCVPLCVNFTGNSAPAAATTLIDFGDGNNATTATSTHCYTTAGNYTITYTVTDINGCTNSAAYPGIINAWPLPIADFSVTPQVTSILNPLVTVVANGCLGCDTTTYTMGLLNDSTLITTLGQSFDYSYSTPGTYTITQTVTNQYGCRDQSTEVVTIEPDFSFYAPTAFTPNEDGINDFFLTFGDGLDLATFELFIFDRWGNMIYYTRDITKGWNGSVNNTGKLCQIDTYIWRANFRDNKGDPHTQMGHVNMIR